MLPPPADPTSPTPPPLRVRAGAYGVHLFTASGIIFAFLALTEICSPQPDPRLVFLYLAIQVLIDAVDGPMARMLDVKRNCPQIDGRTIDDLVDYNTYTLVPLLLIWRMDWLPGPDALWVVPAIVASLFGFSNKGAKDEAHGFFLGFPSYWNIVALYVGAWYAMGWGGWPGAITIAVCTILTVLPVRFLYPNLAPAPWRVPTLVGAVIWTVLIVWIVLWYDRVPTWLMLASLIYPAFYVLLSVWLDLQLRRQERAAAPSAIA